jgi:hypothetical protein
MNGVYSPDAVNFAFSSSTAFGTLQFYANGCGLSKVNVADQYISLYNDDATAVTDGTLGVGPSLQNSQCTLNTAASSAVFTGATLTVKLALTFAPTFAGSRNIYLWGPGTGYPDGASNAAIGTFTVTAPIDRRFPLPR